MRYASVVLACWTVAAALTTTGAAAADKKFPYTAYVNSRDVYVRSGPGRDYYPTEKLQPGAKVEIYRHDPGGWYAIRPTEDSYSWVSSRYLEPTSDGLGQITREKVSSRVGSLLSNVRDVIQVRLHQGELVEILDEVNRGGQTWYKISPPAGEFRWISGRYVDRKKPHDGVSQPRHRRTSKKRSRSSGRAQIAKADQRAGSSDAEQTGNDYQVAKADQQAADTEHTSDDEWKEPDDEDQQLARDESRDDADGKSSTDDALPGDRHVELATWEEEVDETIDDSTGGEAPVTYATADEPVARDDGKSDRNVRRAVHWEDDRGEDQRPKNKPNRKHEPRRDRPQSPAEFKAALKRIDIELAQMVAEEPTVWHFEEMNRRLGNLLEDAATALERGYVRQVLGKIAKFEDIQARFEDVNRVQSATDRANQRLDAARPSEHRDRQVRTAAAWETADRDFDGVGYLRPVVSRRAGAPQYALVDERGAVLSFVTPAPGLQLQSSVGRRIGVTGTRGFMPDYNRPHVMVQRFSDLGQNPLPLRR